MSSAPPILFIPAQDGEFKAKNEALSPAAARLSAYERKSFKCMWRHSPEEVRLRVEAAHKRAKCRVQNVAAKARAHNEVALRIVQRKFDTDLGRAEALRQQVAQTMADAEKRRSTYLSRRMRLSRERHEKENEVKRVLAKKSRERIDRAAREAFRCAEASRLRESHLKDVAERSSKHSERVADAPACKNEVVKMETSPSNGKPEENGLNVSPDAGQGLIDQTFLDAPIADLGSELRKQIDEHRRAGDWNALTLWIQAPQTLSLVNRWLEECRARHEGSPRVVLSLVSMHLHAAAIFDEAAAHDLTMRREVRRFMRQLRAALGARVPSAVQEPFEESLKRARRFHTAWLAIDKPHTIDGLLTSLVALRARERTEESRADDETITQNEEVQHPQRTADEEQARLPEQIFAHLRSIGGPEAEAQGREHYAGQWRAVNGADLQAHVTQIAHQAYWDAVSEAVTAGDYEPLWSVLGELEKATKALAVASARALDDLNDKFDAGWLRTRAQNGALEVTEVAALIRYLCTTIAGWQAPVDNAETGVWKAQVEEMLCSSSHLSLEEFIKSHMVRFVRSAIERVGRVYQRTVQLVEDRDLAVALAADSPPMD